MAEDTIRKLINRNDIIEDLINNVTPKYFPNETLDKHRVSMFGWLVESTAKSIEDTVILEQRRAADYCPELSDSEIRVHQTAKIRGIGVSRATPAHCFAVLGVLKDDIIKKGIATANRIEFIIDRRSTITYGDVNFALEDDIIIRAVHRNGHYIYAANYSGEHSTYESYIQMFEQTNAAGEELIAMICQIYQIRYNISDKIVTDEVEFLYDGLYFDYENKLADFEVYYKQSYTDTYKKANLIHYLSDGTDNRSLYYNDDESGVIRILNNPILNIGTNASIRVEIKETLGTDGNITLGPSKVATFAMYKDAAYNYTGINVFVNILSDTTSASDGDTLADVKKRLIDAKTRRDNITTEHDIITYINDIDANIQIVKKRNDIQDRNYYMYTLVRYGDNHIAPTTTKPLIIRGIQSVIDYGDFDVYNSTVDRKLIRANSKFKLMLAENKESDSDYVVRVKDKSESDPDAMYLTCPYMILINDRNIASYYFNCVDEEIILNMMYATTKFPFQMITRGVSIYRNAHADTNADVYRFTIRGTMNTANDNALVDPETHTVIDPTMVQCHIIFNNDGTAAGFLPMNISDYDPETREFTFTGEITTDDYITEFDKLHVIGLKHIITGKDFNSVIDYKDATFQVSFMYKQEDDGTYEQGSDNVYRLLPEEYTNGYILMNSYNNPSYAPYNLILEFGKFSRSPCLVERYTETTFQYTLGEVPFFEYEFGREYTASLYSTFKHMNEVYSSLLKLTTDFEVSLKFIATYGASKYITVTGGRNTDGNEIIVDINDLTPTLYFKIYGVNVPLDDIHDYIYKYMRETYIIGNSVYMSNICTAIEKEFSAVRSIKYMGVNKLDASYQEFTYNQPVFDNSDVITRYIPEQFNITDIQIELDES